MSTLVATWQERRRASKRPLLLGELLVVFLLLHVYDYVKSLESVRMTASLRQRTRRPPDRAVPARRRGELTLNHWLAYHQTLATALVWWYQYSHISGTMAVLTCCYLWFPHIYRPARNSLVLTNCVGMLVFVLLPVMPPRLLPHAGFIDTVAVAGFGPDHGGPVAPAQFAAMPSLHLAWATWVAVVAFTMLKGKPYRRLVFIYPMITTISVISTGNHYVLDVAAGTALALATLTVCGLLRHARSPVLAMATPSAPVPALEA